MTVRVIQVIYCDELRLGDGRSTDDPIRIVPQVFSLDGCLIASHDSGGKDGARSYVDPNAIRHAGAQP